MRIHSPHPAEPETDDPEAVEPEMSDEEAAEQARERDERLGHEPEVGEPIATEPAAGDGEYVGRESRTAEPENEAEPGIHENVGRESGIHESGIHEDIGHEHADHEPETDEPTGSAAEPGVYEHVGQEPGIGESAAVPPAPHTATYGSADEERVAAEPDVDDFAAAGAAADEPVPYTPVAAEPGAATPTPAPTTEPPQFGAPLIAADESARFHEQIHQIQGTFVDDPRQSVRDAEHLLEDIVRSLAAGLEERRRALTSLSSEDGSGTEELRQALRSYRSLATQLLGPEN